MESWRVHCRFPAMGQNYLSAVEFGYNDWIGRPENAMETGDVRHGGRKDRRRDLLSATKRS